MSSKIHNYLFPDIETMSAVCGANNVNLVHIEKLLGSSIYPKGNMLYLMNEDEAQVGDFKHFLGILGDAVKQGIAITPDFVRTTYVQLTGDSENRFNAESIAQKEENAQGMDYKSEVKKIRMIQIPITDKKVTPRTSGQVAVLKSFEENLLSFLVGPAGTGKTYLATAYALQQLLLKKKARYVITRPVVEAGEKLGFLPGDLEQKIFPYLRPIYDVLHELAGEEIISILQEKKQIEIAPLAYMRGRTLKNSVVLLDEAQNCSPSQMRMFLTRIGEGSIGIVNGDLTQSDLPHLNGLEESMRVFRDARRVNIVKLSDKDIQRGELARVVIEAYNREKAGGGK